MNIKKYLLYIISGLFIIAAIVDFVSTCTGFKELQNITEQYGLRSFTGSLLVLELVFVTMIVIAAVVTIYKTYQEIFDYDEVPTSSLMAINLILALLLHVVSDVTVGYENSIIIESGYSPLDYPAPAGLVAIIVLTVITVIALFVATIFPSKITLKKVCGGLGLISLIVVYIILFCTAEAMSVAIIVNIILFICVLASGVCLFLPGYLAPTRRRYFTSYTPTSTTQTSSQPATQQAPQQKDNQSDDPIKKLKELKELLDSNIITQEEYEEKRKKYLDKI